MIRQVKLSDVKELHRINTEELGYNYSIDKSLSQLKKILNDEKHHILGLYQNDLDGKVLGYIHAELYEEIYADTSLNVLALAVKKSNQHQGIGAELIVFLENQALHRDIHLVRLNSGMSRINAHNFYQHLGFDYVKDQKKFIKEI
ncbi:GNAT family N-acetyltransferase [Leuconostoc citreum]|uniref:GNAT family N-acetyltransferase n=1 Tax=Leuconostoc citreum TaxID=33964 RepID=UPI0032DF4A2D